MVSGEAGVGKTRVVARFALEAQLAGACVLGDGQSTNTFPYGPFAAAVEGYVADRSHAEREELAARYPTLRWLVPSMHSPGVQHVTAGDRDFTHARLGTDIARFLDDVASSRPVVLLLGDLDDTHASNLAVLQYLANLARRRRWLIMGTIREESLVAERRAGRMFTSLEREDLCVPLKMRGLERPACDELVRTLLRGFAVSDGFLDHVASLTLGNPFFIGELVQAMAQRDDVASELGWDDLTPASFRLPVTGRTQPVVATSRSWRC